MIQNAFILVAGLGMLYFGARWLVTGGSALAIHWNVRPLLVGMTVVAFGTSAPEMVVSLQSAFLGQDTVSLGNVVGSNICNIGLILGLTALVRPVRVDIRVIRIDIPVMIGVSLVLALFLLNRHLGRMEGLILLAGLAAFVGFEIREARRVSRESQSRFSPELAGRPRAGARRAWAMAAAGLILLVLGGRLFVRGSLETALSLGISPAFIALTLVAVGTSLPELATSVIAACRRESDLAVGNVVGSNIFNILGILGITALLHPLELGGIGMVDVGFMAVMALGTLPLARSGFELRRWEGIVFLLVWLGYMGLRQTGAVTG